MSNGVDIKDPKGGSEILLDGLKSVIDISIYNINIVLSNCHDKFLDKDKKNIIWQHQNIDQPVVGLMQSKNFVEKIDRFVYVSHWQYENYRKRFFHTFQKGEVVKNAIFPIEYKPRSKDNKIKIIYTSTPWRGLDILIDCISKIDRDDIEVDIYSSNKIYGEGFYNFEGKNYDYILDKAKNTKGVNLMGYASNEEVKKACSEANIFAYPSTFEETSCLSLIEAAAGGCSIVTTSLGALPETSLGYGSLVSVHKNREGMIDNFSKALNESIDTYWDNSVQNSLKVQSDRFNKYYSWENRKHEWEKLLSSISN